MHSHGSIHQKMGKEEISEKLQISIMVFGPKFNKSTCAKGCFLGTEYTPHGRWQFFQQLGSHDA